LSRELSAAGGRLSDREAKLARLAQLQETILGCMPSGLITCAGDGSVTFVNRAAETILGLTSSPVLGGVSVESLIPGVLAQPYVRRGELAVETMAGRRILGLTVTSLQGEDAGAHLIVFQDLSELRRAEDELKRADRLAALGTLSAQLAHEIRNPLASMRGSAQMLAEDEALAGSSSKLARILVREADRLAALVEEFLRFARPPPPSLQACSLRQLVAELVELMGADPLARKVTVKAELEEVIASVDVDQMRQVLLNLIRNALAAAGENGKVRVSLRTTPDEVELGVWDSAGSIPPSDLTRIFEPFFTTKRGGTGLGLSTAHSIVRAHGGMIHVTSSPAAGTEFMVSLPHPKEVET
ncbi:MAG TPA: ATP-binding protein, partial [Myxococcaceae bacterium]|nr:ATP-binding protein [Myxococcaceae bacterium]